MPNCIYLRGTGKIVSVVIFFFTNKVVARTSHACRINARSNKGYLFSSCFESIEIRFRLPAHGSGRCCFLASDYGYGKRKDTYCDPAQHGSRAELQASRSLIQALQALQAAACSHSPGQRFSSCSSRSNSRSQTHLWLTKFFKGRPLRLGAETVLLLRVYLSSSNLIILSKHRQYQKRE